MNDVRVQVTGLTKGFGGVPVLRGVDLDVHVGEVLGLVGENGAGKSTFMNLLGGQLTPDGGTITIEGRAFAPRSPADAAAAGIGFVHQELSLFPNLTIAENLYLRALPRRGWWPGIQQKVVIGKWLLTQPRVLLLDEPTRGIDVAARAELYRLLTALAGDGTALFVISSELEELIGLCDRLLVLRAGEITGTYERDAYDRAAILRAALPATVSA